MPDVQTSNESENVLVGGGAPDFSNAAEPGGITTNRMESKPVVQARVNQAKSATE